MVFKAKFNSWEFGSSTSCPKPCVNLSPALLINTCRASIRKHNLYMQARLLNDFFSKTGTLSSTKIEMLLFAFRVQFQLEQKIYLNVFRAINLKVICLQILLCIAEV